MRWNDPLRARLERLYDASDPHVRGREFERIVAEIFTRAGFDVVMDPEAASPRQTDMFVSDRHAAFLVEAKWMSGRIGSPEVDGMRSRLRRQPSSTVGVIVTMGGVSEQALAEIERERDRVIVLLEQPEVDALADSRADLRRLLRLKQRQLVVHAKSSGSPPEKFVSSPRDGRESPRLVGRDGSQLPWIVGTSSYLDSCWVLSLPDIDWVIAGGTGVTLDLDLPVASLDELGRTLDHLAALNWLGPDAAWTMQQNARTWSGFGLERLLMAIRSRDSRYATLDDPHHREMLVVTSVCSGGWYTLLADLDAWSERVQRASLSLQLLGVPEDPGPIAQIRDRLAIMQPGFFRPRRERSVRQRRLDETIIVTPRALVVEHDPDDQKNPTWVRGIVFDNPWMGADSQWPALVRRESQVIASLRSWHPLSKPRSRYVLERFEWAESSDACLVHAIADW